MLRLTISFKAPRRRTFITGMNNDTTRNYEAAKANLEAAQRAYDWIMSAARRQKKAPGCDAELHGATMRDISAAMVTALLELNNAKAEEFMARVLHERALRR